MIYPRLIPRARDVASHYDDLDHWYRELWGEHVHHGLWETGGESAALAAQQLTHRVAREAGITAGQTVVDAGCGYGGTARILAQGFGAQVIGYTLSRAQYQYAIEKNGHAETPRYHLQNWLDNELADASTDVVLSIESSEHMEDKARFFAQAHRVLKPGGRLVVCAWLARANPTVRETEWLLEPICREARLPGMGNEDEYRDMIRQAGFDAPAFQDLSQQVKKTWSVVVGRMARRLLWDREAWSFLARGPNREFARAVLRIWVAYNTGSMRYGLFTCAKPR